MDQQPILLANCHSVSGSSKSHHDIPGKTPEARVRFKQNCLILALQQLHIAALAPQQGKSVQYILAGDFNLANSDFLHAMRGWKYNLHWVAAKNRDYIVSNTHVRDIVENDSDLPTAHDNIHYAIACEVYIEKEEAQDLSSCQQACYHTPTYVRPTNYRLLVLLPNTSYYSIASGCADGPRHSSAQRLCSNAGRARNSIAGSGGS